MSGTSPDNSLLIASFRVPVSAAPLAGRVTAPAAAAGGFRQTAGPCRLLVTLAHLHAHLAARADTPENVDARSAVIDDASVRDPHAVAIGAVARSVVRDDEHAPGAVKACLRRWRPRAGGGCRAGAIGANKL